MKNAERLLYGFVIGLINSILGSCGGVISVIALKKNGFNQQEAHANAITIILPLAVISCVNYIISGYFNPGETFVYLPGGIVGATIGGLILPKIPQKHLKKLFSVFIIWAGIRMISR